MYLVTGYSDLRKGIEGLAAVVQGNLSLDPFNKSLYLFCGRRRDRIKGLLWEKPMHADLIWRYVRGGDWGLTKV